VTPRDTIHVVWRWWAPASVVVALLVACVSTEGLTNDGAGTDAGGVDGAIVTDGGSSEGSSADGSTDGPGSADAGVGCAVLMTRTPAPRFCDDLDDSDAGVAGWPLSDLGVGAVFERVETFAHSAPASLHAKTPAATEDDYHYAYVRRNFAGTVDRVRYELDAFFVKAPATTGSFVAFANLHFPSAAGYVDLRLEGDRIATGAVTMRLQQTLEVPAGDRYLDTPLTDPLPIGRWFHIVIDVDLATSPHNVKVTFDGMLEADVDLDPVYVPGDVGITFGIRYGSAKGGTVGQTEGWEAYFDNAAVY
jgi:hypothetical protein